MWKAIAGLLVLVMIATVPRLTAADEEKYSTKYDNVDVDEILNNERLFNKYVDCVLDDGQERCTPDGAEMKALIPESLRTDCAKCSDKQKARMDKIITFIRDKKDVWQKLSAKYDPDGTYYKNIERHLKKTA